ncbi:MAG: hypothetical protein LBN21_05640 [Treponema sp.]|nr:hypothetical protein [Treponema sp.]
MEYKILEDNETVHGIFCFVDIEGHTQWAYNSGDEKLKKLLEILYGNGFKYFGKDKYKTVNNTKYKRRVVKFLGDGFFTVREYNNNDKANFDNNFDKMMASISEFYDRTAADIKNNIHKDLGLKFGIAFGESKRFKVNKRLDYIGNVINFASRLCGISGAAEISILINNDDILSKKVKTYTGPICKENIEGVGDREVKKIKLPFELVNVNSKYL